MANLNDIIFNRELRTTCSVYKADRNSLRSANESETCENCDKIEKCRQKNYYIKSHKYRSSHFSSKLINCFIVVTSIFILSSTSQIEAHPVHIQKRQVTKMTEIEMKKALENILTGCKVAISQSSDAIETYYDVVWNTDKKNHSKTWGKKKMVSIMTWLYPKGELRKDYEGTMHQDHRVELENTTWDLKMVFEYLEDIYERLCHIRLGFEVINRWLGDMNADGILRPDEFESMTSLFNNASGNIYEVIMQIQIFFKEASNNDYELKAIDAEPMKIDDSIGKENIKLQHWFVYREYEHVMEYAKELIDIINKEPKSTQN